MYNYYLSLFAGLFAMISAISSYFFYSRLKFLIAQGIALIMLALSFLFIEQYFATASYMICVARVLVYFFYERKNQPVPFLVQSFFALLTVCAYFTINVTILKTFKPLDILLMVSGIMYTYVFGVRNLMLLRYLIILPTAMTIVYNVLVGATPFVIVSYSFEMLANLTAIVLYKLNQRKARRKSKGRQF
jgi:hypothetical protein